MWWSHVSEIDVHHGMDEQTASADCIQPDQRSKHKNKTKVDWLKKQIGFPQVSLFCVVVLIVACLALWYFDSFGLA